MLHLPWIKSLLEKSLRLFPSAYWPLSVCKISKKSLAWIQSYEDGSFLGPDWSICPKQELFLGKVINTISIYLLNPFIVQSLKRFLQWIQSYEDVSFWTQNGPIFFLRKILFLSFMPMYIPKTKFRYQSINDILTIKEYWNLIGWESFLAITWESCFSQTCSFFQNVKGPEEPSFYINSKQN